MFALFLFTFENRRLGTALALFALLYHLLDATFFGILFAPVSL